MLTALPEIGAGANRSMAQEPRIGTSADWISPVRTSNMQELTRRRSSARRISNSYLFKFTPGKVQVKGKDHIPYQCPDCGRSGTPQEIMSRQCCFEERPPHKEKFNRFKVHEYALKKRDARQDQRDRELLLTQVRHVRAALPYT